MAAVKSQEFPSLSLSRCKYQVFLSFRGKDTRKNFTDHLYSALVEATIHTFRDDDEIPRGGNIESEIQKAIEQSKIAIVVLSEDYASSRWCLDELVMIMEQKKTAGLRKVMPIFYHVCPSDVGEQTGTFGRAFVEHEKHVRMEQVNGWRIALTEVADLAGTVIGEEHGEAVVVKSIVKEVSEELNPTKFYIPHFIGRDLLIKDICSWLGSGPNSSEIAMLYGTEGVGKTTIAKKVYNQCSDHFESISFLGDIRQKSKGSDGLVPLQSKLLNDVLIKNASQIHDVDEGIIKIKDVICCRRIFLVLDDLDTKDQFNAIIGMRKWLCPGSKIIVTTRNEHLFAAPEECEKFEVKRLPREESFQLLKRHASVEPHLENEFENVSTFIVDHSYGLPSKLRRYGSKLCSSRKKEDWGTALQEIRSEFQKAQAAGRGKIGGLNALCAVPDPPMNPVGYRKALGELKELLFKEGVSMVVLYASPGCGKTTLAKLLCNDREVKEKYQDNIFYVTVSKNTSMESIVRRLFKHKRKGVGKFNSDEDVVYHLEQFLKNIGPDPILLVLDDVWPDWKSHLEKFRFQIANLKILVTSRSKFKGLGSSYKLNPLNPEDAMTLFRQLALPPDENSYTPEDHIVEEIVKYCKGFPLAISVVAKSLRCKDAADWRKRLKECSKPASIFSNSELFNCLQSSVDAMDDSVKECYMDLGSFPKDCWIPADSLIDMWAELYNLDEDDAMINLRKLSDRILAERLDIRKDEKEDNGSYNEHFVMQHDLLRDLAIFQSSRESIESRKRVFVDVIGNSIPEWLMKLMQPLISTKLLSISTDETSSACCCNLQAPGVEVLVLNFQTNNYSLPTFLGRMDMLKVLILNNHGFFAAELNNFQLGALSNLKRIRLEKVIIPILFLTNMQLTKLEKMSLVMCDVGRAFNNSAITISDAFPNLVEVNIDYSEDLRELPTGFCDLVLLKKLSITNCHKLSALPQEIGKLRNLEDLRLNSCTELSEMPDSIGGLDKLQILDISDCSSITKLPEQIGQLRSLRKLYMIDCLSCEFPTSVMHLANLKEVIVDEITAVSWKRFKAVLPSLKIKVHKEINLNFLRNDSFKQVYTS